MTGTRTDWNPLLRGEFDEPYWHDLQAFVRSERERFPVYPPVDQVFRPCISPLTNAHGWCCSARTPTTGRVRPTVCASRWRAA
ncbi:MAG: hypothetical protein R2713_16340 [Ilumatobacteraceae bacterium]